MRSNVALNPGPGANQFNTDATVVVPEETKGKDGQVARACRIKVASNTRRIHIGAVNVRELTTRGTTGLDGFFFSIDASFAIVA